MNDFFRGLGGRQSLDVVIATHSGAPSGAPDDIILGHLLEESELSVRMVPWRDTTFPWSKAKVVLIRSTWDYHDHYEDWLEWVAHVAGQTKVLNSADLLRWNGDKRYLVKLLEAGVPCIPTQVVTPFAKQLLGDDAHPYWILKPSVGASAKGVKRFNLCELRTDGIRYAEELSRGGVALLQPFIPEVLELGERSLVYFGCQFSHAFKKPEFNRNSSGTTVVASHMPTAEEMRVATLALKCLPEEPLYARVDLVPSSQGPLVIELELIEPDLVLRKSPQAAARFAALLHGML